jgi:hypothetical protein
MMMIRRKQPNNTEQASSPFHIAASSYSAANTPAAPIPDPMHMLTTPVFLWLRFISCNSVATHRAPVAPGLLTKNECQSRMSNQGGGMC